MNDKIKKICKNYNIIVNCEFLDDDMFSHKLVDYYKNAVSRVKNDDSTYLEKITKIDRMMRKYIEDYNFSKKLKNSVDVSSIVASTVDLTDVVLDYAVSFSDKYEENIEEPVINTRWI